MFSLIGSFGSETNHERFRNGSNRRIRVSILRNRERSRTDFVAKSIRNNNRCAPLHRRGSQKTRLAAPRKSVARLVRTFASPKYEGVSRAAVPLRKMFVIDDRTELRTSANCAHWAIDPKRASIPRISPRTRLGETVFMQEPLCWTYS